MKKTRLNSMSWLEFKMHMEVDDLIIIPVGSHEEHGPQNPLSTDFLIADIAAERIGQKSGAVVAPTIPIGQAKDLMEFPGTITLDYGDLRDFLLQICENFIRHGAKKFLFINGHGGNRAVIDMVCTDLYYKYKVFALQSEWWKVVPQLSNIPCNDHGGQHETSMVLGIDETLVQMNKAKTVEMNPISQGLCYDYGFSFQGVRVNLGHSFRKVSSTGCEGAPPELASKELGERIMKIYVDYCTDLVDEMRKVNITAKQEGSICKQ